MIDPGAEEIARPWRSIAPWRRRDRRESVAGLALVALFVGATLLCVGLLAPPVWMALTGKLMSSGVPVSSAVHSKQPLKPFGEILVDQLDNPSRAGAKGAR